MLELESTDQAHLSGVDAAPPAMSALNGAYIATRLDGHATEIVRGNRASVPIDTDGHHTVAYRAFDAAGNGSVEKEVVVRVDGTAPVGAFKALDPADPRALEVQVSDATSGVADGRIEYRRVGEREFAALPTRLADGALSARLDDEKMASGRYELRAVVDDVAGNQVVIDRWVDGAAATLGMPLRLGSELRAAGEGKVTICGRKAGKPTRKRAARRKRRTKCRQSTKATKELEQRFGVRAASSGRLTTAQGVGIAGATVVVEGQSRSGGAFVRLGTASTGADGGFRFAIPAGPSRAIRYRYEGTNTVRPAEAAIATRVAAAARLTVDRRRVRNGKAVRFSGRLLGTPIPATGKLVALQARVARGWRTFATPRANANGVFAHRYRFTSTTGVRRYAFRAVVAREAAYPYERGVSRTVRVTVRGR